MNNIEFSEKIKFALRQIYKSIKYINSRSENANKTCDELLDLYNRNIIVSDSDDKTSQSILMSTIFGNPDANSANIPEFTYSSGSRLRYDRVLGTDHKDGKEVVNFQTLVNIVSAIKSSSGQYVTNDGNQTLSGSYTFKKDAANTLQSITFDGIDVNVKNGGVINLEKGYLDTVDSGNGKSLVNKTFLDNYLASGGAVIQGYPVFISGKIGYSSLLNNAITRTYGKYDWIAVSNTGLSRVKLLKYNATASWDGSDRSWVSLFGNTPNNQVSGSGLSISSNRIPYPCDFDLYIEYEVDAAYSFAAYNTYSRIRQKVPAELYSVILDSDGDLCLVFNNRTIYSPIYGTTRQILTNSDSTDKTLFYLVVKRWSYYPIINSYIDTVGLNSAPQLLFINRVYNRVSTDTGSKVIKYYLYNANIDGAITWTHNSTLSITFGSDGNGYYANITFPEGETEYTITFTATYSGGTLSISKTVTLQLLNAITPALSMTPVSYSDFSTVDPIDHPFSFEIDALNGTPNYTWTLESMTDGLTAVSITPGATSDKATIAGIISLPSISNYATILLKDSTYGSVAGTGTISTDGTTLSITGVTTSIFAIGKYVKNGTEERRIESIDSTSAVTLDSAFSTNLSSVTSYDIISGQYRKKMLIKYTYIDGGNDPVISCFGDNTYILTSNGGKLLKDIPLNTKIINVKMLEFLNGKIVLNEDIVLEKFKHRFNDERMLRVFDVDVTANHSYGLDNGLWKECKSLSDIDFVVSLNDGEIISKQFGVIKNSNYIGDLHNIHTSEMNYFVSSSPNGPWQLVHNKITSETYDELNRRNDID